MLQSIPGVAICPPVQDAATLRARLQESPFDALLLDMFLPGGAAPTLIGELHLCSECMVIVLGPADCAQLVRHERPGNTIHFFPKCRELPQALELLRQLSASNQANSGVSQ